MSVEWCTPVHSVWKKAVDDLRNPAESGSRHEIARNATRALVALGGEGHRGVRPAVEDLSRVFAEAVGPERIASGEWHRSLLGAVRLAATKNPTPRTSCEHDPATALPASLLPAVPPLAPFSQPPGPTVDTSGGQPGGRSLDDIGNGERLFDLAAGRYRYVGDHQIWRAWDGMRWVEDSLGSVRELAKAAVRGLWREADALDPGEIPYPVELAGDDPGNPFMETKEVKAWREEWMTTPEGKAYSAATEKVAKIRKWAARCQLRDRIEASVSMFTTVPTVASRAVEYDRHPRLFNTAGGTLDTDTLTIRPHEPANMLTKLTPIEPGGDAPLWRAFMEMNLPDPETRRYFQKLAGYSLTGRANEKAMAYLYGPSDTGKSIAAAVLLAVHGEDDGYGYQAPKGALAPRKHGDEGRDPDRHGMRGARLVVTSETRPGEPMDEALIKSLTGRDTQNTRGNYAKGNTPWTPEMLLMVCSNQYPRITGDDDAIWTRIKVIPFMVQFLAGDPRRDERLQEKILRDELPGVLAWCIEGLRLYEAEGLTASQEIDDATAQFRASGDGVARWLEDGKEDNALTFTDASWIKRAELHVNYKAWASDNGIHSPLNGPRLYARLTALGYKVTTRAGVRGFSGIGLNPFTPAQKVLAMPAWTSHN